MTQQQIAERDAQIADLKEELERTKNRGYHAKFRERLIAEHVEGTKPQVVEASIKACVESIDRTEKDQCLDAFTRRICIEHVLDNKTFWEEVKHRQGKMLEGHKE